jgi:hypothetical protein
MTLQLDFILLPIVRQPEHDQGLIPGLLVAEPPRRSARGRHDDRLFLRLTLGGNAMMELQDQTRLLEKAVQIYYKSSGAVTGAIRKTITFLNQEILTRNLHNAGRGLQTIGYLTVGVLKPDTLYLAQCGPTHAFLSMAQGSEHHYDPQLSGRGLGLARTTQVRYLQLTPQAGDLLLLSTQPSPAWTPEFLQERRQAGLEALRRDLIGQVEIDPFALLIQARPGSGRLRTARPKPVALVQDQSAGLDDEEDLDELTGRAAASAAKPAEKGLEKPAAGLTSAARQGTTVDIPGGEAAVPASPLISPPPIQKLPVEEAAPSADALPDVQLPAEESSVAPSARPASPAPRLPRPNLNVRPALSAFVRRLDSTFSSFGQALRASLKRIAPEDSAPDLSNSLLAFMAVAVPLVVVAIAWTVYTQRGQESVYTDYLDQAFVIASQAEGETDADVLRQIYSDALVALDRAEQQQVSDQSTALRSQIQGAYDDLEWIERLDFQPAIIGGLESGLLVSRIVVADEDLFLLDASGGRVIHAELSPQGYEIDRGFLCGPGLQNGPLVDIVPLPRSGLDDILSEGGEQPKLLGIDANGNLLYCRTDGPPIARELPTPDSNWGRVEAMRYDSGILYVLDPGTNAVWYYPGEGGLFNERPGFFFDESVPNLRNVIDIAVDRSDLYLLHDNGEMGICVYSSLETAPTRCSDPANFTDPRKDRGVGPTIEGVLFTQSQFSQPPEPSIYLMDPINRAVYHFSVRLTQQRQYRARTPLPEGGVTAFVVGPNRRLFLAQGDRLYVAQLP